MKKVSKQLMVFYVAQIVLALIFVVLFESSRSQLPSWD